MKFTKFKTLLFLSFNCKFLLQARSRSAWWISDQSYLTILLIVLNGKFEIKQDRFTTRACGTTPFGSACLFRSKNCTFNIQIAKSPKEKLCPTPFRPKVQKFSTKHSFYYEIDTPLLGFRLAAAKMFNYLKGPFMSVFKKGVTGWQLKAAWTWCRTILI